MRFSSKMEAISKWNNPCLIGLSHNHTSRGGGLYPFLHGHSHTACVLIVRVRWST
jgi:hypothetical protein